jgi:hypothetical protein
MAIGATSQRGDRTLTAPCGRRTIGAVDDEDLDPREAERTRRRDHDASGAERDLMRPGMGKVFKQILDRQGREARLDREREAEERPKSGRPEGRRRGRGA